MTTVCRGSLAIKMKKRIIAAAATVALMLILASCSSSDLVKLKYDNGNLIDEKNNITYINAPMCFEPIATEAEPCAETDSGLQLYGIMGLDTSLWLSEKFEGIGSVYYAEGEIELPTLSEFGADGIMICIEETITTGLGAISDPDDIDSIIEAFETGERTTIIPEGEVYKLKFSSSEYEGIYYNLVYIEADGGNNYIYDRSSKICADVGDVLLKYLPRLSES